MFSLNSLRDDTPSWQSSLSLALASDIAYQDFRVMQATTRAWGLPTFHPLDHEDTQGFVAAAPDVVLIAFRGTQEIGDVLDDIDVLPTTMPYGNVHSGFLGAYRAVASDLGGFLGGLDLATKKVWLTGHSLGGAVATVAAAEHAGSVPFTGIQTFGQPRVGDDTMHAFFESNYAGRFTRFVNNNDVVPRIPPGYEHVGHLVRFDDSGGVRRAMAKAAIAAQEPPPLTRPEFEALKAQVKALKAAAQIQSKANRAAFVTSGLEFSFPSLLDHRLARYIEILTRLAGGAAPGVT